MTLLEKPIDSNGLQWSERPVRLQQRFLVLRKLGQGTYGKVQLALNKETNQEVAIKTIKKARIESEEDMLRIRREIQIMASIHHPHIIHINEVFETRQKIVIVMQYASGGELYDYLGCHHKLPEEEARRIFRQIASAIYYCHKNRICHRDLKLENILLDEEGNAQIADFGLSNIFDERRRMNTFCGSPLYASPEIVKGTPYKGPEVDCWSLGVLLYTLIYGTMPFDGRNFKELVSQISEGKYEEPTSKSSASSLIRSLLTPDISKRATISDVCKDYWVNFGYKDSLLSHAEQMTLVNQLNGENLATSKLCFEKITKNGFGKSSTGKANCFPELQNGKINLSSIFKNSTNTSRPTCDKSTLYEQILNYDVRFVINKLLATVESSFDVNETPNILHPVKEKSSLKPWPRNGEISTVSKVDSAYVIPIFEVTSVMPKLTSKLAHLNHSTNRYFKQTENTDFLNGENNDIFSKEKKKASKEKTKRKEQDPQSAIPKIEIFPEISNMVKKSENSNTLFQATDHKHTNLDDQRKNLAILTDKSEHFKEEYKLDVNQENILPRIPSPKARRRDENMFHHKFGPFFRTKNHALSLARLFSLNYDKLSINPLKLPERRHKKSPGKIVIPATFDPSLMSETVSEKKEIIIFPTISVSENKEKIEKKIDKIKKAALNMNLIRRSNSKNRLKIQKYLMSQAKKIQDLVSDEHRSMNNSMEHIKRCETTSAISDAYFGKCGGQYFNSRYHNKKINFLMPNNIFQEKTKNDFKLFGSRTNLLELKPNFDYLNISKSRSEEITFTDGFLDFSLSHGGLKNCTLRQYQFNIQDGLSKDCCTKLLRSASDSKTAIPKIEAIEKGCIALDSSSEELSNNCQSVLSNESLSNQDSCSRVHVDQPLNENIVEMHRETKSSESTSNTSDEYNEHQIPCFDINSLLISSPIINGQTVLQKSSCLQLGTRMKRLSSEPNLRDAKYVEEVNNEEVASSNEPLQYQINSIESTRHYKSVTGNARKEFSRKGRLSRRNTLGCITDFTNDKKYTYLQDSKEKASIKTNDFHDYLWMMYVNKKILGARGGSKFEFSSSPNIYNFSDDKNWMNDRGIDSKSVDEINMKLYEASLTNTSVYGLNEAKSAFLRRLLKSPDSNNFSNYHMPKNSTRIKSVSEEVLSHNENADYLRKTQSERKLSLPQVIDQNETRKTPFLSKFLNELENRQTFKNTKGSTSPRKTLTRNSLGLDKKSKAENRNKSFLQLLSLKRIQEAEKELHRIEKTNSIESEEENSGSLLEALKMHGYKNVISQRFQADEDEEDIMNFRHLINSFPSRNITPDIPRAYLNSYETMMHNGTSYYDYGEYNDFNGFTSPLPFHLDTNYNPKFSKQFVHDWLTTNLSEKYLDSTKLDRSVPIIPEEQVQTICATDKRFRLDKDTSLSFEEEPSSSESFEMPKEYFSNGTAINDFGKTVDSLNDHSIATGMERNPLLRTSSTSEDEKEESVQDRIWRKSFYSRFNNSVLSRKDRSKFLDTDIISERSGFVNGRSSPLRSSSRERSESFQWNMRNKNSPLKRAATMRHQSSRRNSEFEISSKIKSSNSFRHELLDTSPKVDKNNDVNFHEAEAEH